MSDLDIDILIKERITAEGREIPQYLQERKRQIFNNLESAPKRKVPFWRYATAVVLAIIMCSLAYAVSFTAMDSANKEVKQSTSYAMDETYDKANLSNNCAVTEEDKKKAAAEGFVVERAAVAGQEKPNTSQQQFYDILPQHSNADISAAKPLPDINTIQKLADASGVVIQGQVIGVKYLDAKDDFSVGAAGSSVYTEVLVKVVKSYKDNTRSGEILTFIEKGGVTTRYNYLLKNGMLDKFKFTEEEIEKAKDEKVLDMEYLDVPLMKPEDKVFLFGQDIGTEYGLMGKLYRPSYGFWGKFIVNGEFAQRHIPFEWQTADYAAKIEVSSMEASLEEWSKAEK